jgi:Phosphoribosylglycinamide synthetase, ATP-grasp (A) domain
VIRSRPRADRGASRGRGVQPPDHHRWGVGGPLSAASGPQAGRRRRYRPQHRRHGAHTPAPTSPFPYSPTLTSSRHTISEKVIEAIARETGRPYKGVLYGGFIATADGIDLIEYNARFGDPEAMNVLPILDADFAEVSFAVAERTLGAARWSFQHKATVRKYIVPKNYPQRSEPTGLDVSSAEMDSFAARWFWAACEQIGEKISISSPRTGAFVGIGNSLNEAEAQLPRAGSYGRTTVDTPTRVTAGWSTPAFRSCSTTGTATSSTSRSTAICGTARWPSTAPNSTATCVRLRSYPRPHLHHHVHRHRLVVGPRNGGWLAATATTPAAGAGS